MGLKMTDTKKSKHRKTKAVLAAGAVAGTVAATAAYRRRQAESGSTARPGPSAGGPETAPPL